MKGGDHHIPGSSFSCLVKVYDMPESQVKLNYVAEFIGVYTFDPEFAAAGDNSQAIMFDPIEDVIARRLLARWLTMAQIMSSIFGEKTWKGLRFWSRGTH